MSDWPWVLDTCKLLSPFLVPLLFPPTVARFFPFSFNLIKFDANTNLTHSYALAADIQTIPGLPTAPGYLNVDIDPETGEIDGLF